MTRVKVIVLVAVALLVGSAVTAGAARMITGKQVANGSLTGADVKNGSLTGSDVKNRSISAGDLTGSALSALKSTTPGPQGAKGDKGDQGDQGSQGVPGPKGDRGDVTTVQGNSIVGPKGDPGPQGPKGDTGVLSIVFHSGAATSVAAPATTSVSARCDVGEKVIGGTVDGSGGEIAASSMNTDASPQSIEFKIHNEGPDAASYTATAVCVR